MQPLSRDQVRRVDRMAIAVFGISGVVLMENAGRHAASAILDLLRDRQKTVPNARVAVICGGGNNGGDGYVIARHLHNAAATVRVYSTSDPADLKGDALVNCQIVKHMQLDPCIIRDEDSLAAAASDWHTCDVLVDALLGTGFTGSLRPQMASVIAACNAACGHGPSIVAIDIPSGLDCDTGATAQPTIIADLTVTFVASKIGFACPAAKRHLGKVVVVDIGVPAEIIDRVIAASENHGD